MRAKPSEIPPVGKAGVPTVGQLIPLHMQERITQMSQQKFALDELTKDWPRRKITRRMRLRFKVATWFEAIANRIYP